MTDLDVSRRSSVSIHSGPGTSSSRSTSRVSNRFFGLPIAPRPLSAISVMGVSIAQVELVDLQADQAGFELLRAGEGIAQAGGQGAVARDADRFLLALQGVFGHHAALGLAE